MIDSKSIEELAGKIDLLTVVEKYARGPVKKRGAGYSCLSPFTKEKTPSMFIRPDKGYFKDFSSGKGGDAITFIMEIEQVNYVESLRILAEIFNVELKESEDTESFSLSQKAHVMNDLFMKNLQSNPVALEYVTKRFGANAAERFGIGLYTTEGNMDVKRELGLLWEGKDKPVQPMKDRITFPVRGRVGRIQTYFARTMGDDKPKYIGGTNTRWYNKPETLYGLHENARSIMQDNLGYLVEGQPDVITMFRYGYPALSPMGTSMSSVQIGQCKKLTRHWIVLFDGDDAGRRATVRVVEEFAEEGIEVDVALLPEGSDPDSYLQENKSMKVPPMPGFDFLKQYEGEAKALHVAHRFLNATKKLLPANVSWEYIKLADRFVLDKNIFERQFAQSKPIKDHKPMRLERRWNEIIKRHQIT